MVYQYKLYRLYRVKITGFISMHLIFLTKVHCKLKLLHLLLKNWGKIATLVFCYPLIPCRVSTIKYEEFRCKSI